MHHSHQDEDIRHMWRRCKELEADNARLRAALRQYEDEIETDLGGKDDAADRLSLAVNGHKAGARELLGGNDCLLFKQSLAHIERLRAALREIASIPTCPGAERERLIHVARKALEAKHD